MRNMTTAHALDRLLQSPMLIGRSDGPLLALYTARVPAGAPHSADEEADAQRVSLNEVLVRSPGDTFLLRVTGDSMTGAGIQDGDLLTVDRKLPARSGHIVVATVDGQTTVKTLHRAKGARKGELTLLPQNDRYPPIEVRADSEFSLLGVVTNVIRGLY